MDITNSIVNYRRFLKRRNFSSHTVVNYLNRLKQFILWIEIPIELVTDEEIGEYIDALLDRRLTPVTINCHLRSIRVFYHYLRLDEGIRVTQPVKRGVCLRVPRPLPRFLNDDEVKQLFSVIKNIRDLAIFKIMLRCGLRVEEVANLICGAVDLKRRRIMVHGKGSKDRMVYISDDAKEALDRYLKLRTFPRVKKVFLVEKVMSKSG
jgi:site-specific recombinase XerD